MALWGLQIHYFLLNFYVKPVIWRHKALILVRIISLFFCPKYPTSGTRSVKSKTPIDMRFFALNRGFYGGFSAKFGQNIGKFPYFHKIANISKSRETRFLNRIKGIKRLRQILLKTPFWKIWEPTDEKKLYLVWTYKSSEIKFWRVIWNSTKYI